MSKQDETLMEFPCDFAIKAMGPANCNDDELEFDALVVSLIREHIKDLNEGAVKTKPSSGGKYISVTVSFRADSREQLDDIYRSLSGHERVVMTL